MKEFTVFNYEMVIKFAKWLQKKSGTKKRFVYGGKLTKIGSLCVVLALTSLSQVVLKKWIEIVHEGNK